MGSPGVNPYPILTEISGKPNNIIIIEKYRDEFIKVDK